MSWDLWITVGLTIAFFVFAKKILIFLFGWTMPFWRWLEPAFCGEDMKASYRKLSAFAIIFMIGHWCEKLALMKKEEIGIYHIYVLAILVLLFLLLVGLITAPMLIDIYKNGKTNGDVNKP